MRRSSFIEKLKWAGAAAAAVMAMGMGGANAIVLPSPPSCGLGPTNNCLQFQDFTVYSLALLNFQAGAGTPGPGDPFYVPSSPGRLQDSIVIGSHPSSARDNQDILPGVVDNAYDTPDNIHTGFANFVMLPNKDPIANGFTGDNARQGSTSVVNPNVPFVPDANPPVNTLPLWDIPVSALNSILGPSSTNHPVFFFNLNEENGGTLDSGQDMLGWMRVYLTDYGADNQPGGTGANADVVTSFTLGGIGNAGLGGPCLGIASACQDQTAGVDDILQTAADKWAYVHGQLCVSNTGAVLNFGACPGGSPGTTVNQNLGANTAAFALDSKGLDDALATGNWDLMSVDLRMAHLGNGYEQLFILPCQGTTCNVPPPVPEPGSLPLLATALGMLGLGWLYRRRRPAKA